MTPAEHRVPESKFTRGGVFPRESVSEQQSMAALREYIECEECGFVLLSENRAEAEPKRVDSCPDCDGAEFELVGS